MVVFNVTVAGFVSILNFWTMVFYADFSWPIFRWLRKCGREWISAGVQATRNLRKKQKWVGFVRKSFLIFEKGCINMAFLINKFSPIKDLIKSFASGKQHSIETSIQSNSRTTSPRPIRCVDSHRQPWPWQPDEPKQQNGQNTSKTT